MTLDEALAALSVVGSTTSAISGIKIQPISNFPVGEGILHLFLCVLAGLFFPKEYNLIVLVSLLIFFSVLIDSHYSKLWAQSCVLLLGLPLIIREVGLSKITANSHGWLAVITMFVVFFALPILVGMKFFRSLRQKNFPVPNLALLLSFDYSLGILIGHMIRDL
jgi:hypothetical protein